MCLRCLQPGRRLLHLGRPHVLPLDAERQIEIAELPDRFDVGSYPSPSAYAMTEFFAERHAELLPTACNAGGRPRVLEIGAGTGAVGLACAALGSDVILTEREALLAQIRANVELNRATVAGAGGSTRVLPLDWKIASHLEALVQEFGRGASPPFDLMIGSDLIYPATSAIYSKLLRVLLSLPAKRVLFAYPFKRDRAPAKFFTQAVEMDFGVQELHRNEKHVVAIVELTPPASG